MKCSLKRAKGQLSAEMIILAAVLIAIVALVAISLTKTAQGAGSAVENQSGKILNRTDEIVSNFTVPSPQVPEHPYLLLSQ